MLKSQMITCKPGVSIKWLLFESNVPRASPWKGTKIMAEHKLPEAWECHSNPL